MCIRDRDYRQYRAARRLVHECCNYDSGNCLLLQDSGGKPAAEQRIADTPVSYTHLDVYKRQVETIEMSHKWVNGACVYCNKGYAKEIN